MTGDNRARGKDGATDKETRGTDHVTWLGVTIRGLLLGVPVRGVSRLVLGLVLRERRDKTGKEETLHTVWAGQTCKAGGTGKTDKAAANSRTREALCPSDLWRVEAGEALALSSS